MIGNIPGSIVCDVCSGHHAARVLADDGDELVNQRLPAWVRLCVFDPILSVAARAARVIRLNY